VDVAAIASYLAAAVVRGLHGEPLPEIAADGFCRLVMRESA
jgi:hypothetical protein